MEIVLAEPKLLKEPINIISELVNEVRFTIDNDKIEMIAMDPANVAMVNFKLLSSAFIEYDVKKKYNIALQMDQLKAVLRRAKPSDTLKISLDEVKNKLKIQLKGDSTRTFHLNLLQEEEKQQKIPDLKFPVQIEMNTVVFNEAVEDMDVIAVPLKFLVQSDKCLVSAEGLTSQAHVEMPKDDETMIKFVGSGEIKAKYSIEYLKKIIKGSKLADRVTIRFIKDYPLMVDYMVKDKLQLTTILAPRVSEE